MVDISQAAESYLEVDITGLLNRTDVLAVDLYIRLGTHYTKIFNKNDVVDTKRFASYYKKGVKFLYIHISQKPSYFYASQKFIQGLIPQANTSGAELLRAAIELSEQAFFDLRSEKLFDKDAIEKAIRVTENCLRKLVAEGNTIVHLFKLCRSDNYLGMHSVATAVISNLIAQSISMVQEPFLHQLTMASLFHDVGLSALPIEITDPLRNLKEAEYNAMKEHTALGTSALSSDSTIAPAVLEAIKCHHENFDGSGYPGALAGESIPIMARVLSLADSFSALNTSRGPNPRLANGVETLKMIQDDIIRFDSKLAAGLFGLAGKQIA